MGMSAKIDHFADMRKMVLMIITGCFTSGYGFINHKGEIPPLRIAQEHLKITGAPKLGAAARIFTNHVFKTRMQLNDNLFIYKRIPFSCLSSNSWYPSRFGHAANILTLVSISTCAGFPNVRVQGTLMHRILGTSHFPPIVPVKRARMSLCSGNILKIAFMV